MILENRVAVSTTEEEDPRNSGHVLVRPGEPRDVLIVVLIQNKFSYIVVDDEAAAKDGKFLSKDDLRERAKVSKTVVETMSDLGLLDGMPEGNQLSIFDL